MLKSTSRISPIRYFHYALLLVAIIVAINLAELLWITDEQFKLLYSDLFSPIYNLIATVCMFVAARQSFRKSRRLRLAWGILGCAQLFFMLGDVVWAYPNSSALTYTSINSGWTVSSI
jgi:hypothetical protein